MVFDLNFNGRIFVDQKLFFGDFEIGFSIGKFKVRVHFHCLTVRSFYILDMFEITHRSRSLTVQIIFVGSI